MLPRCREERLVCLACTGHPHRRRQSREQCHIRAPGKVCWAVFGRWCLAEDAAGRGGEGRDPAALQESDQKILQHLWFTFWFLSFRSKATFLRFAWMPTSHTRPARRRAQQTPSPHLQQGESSYPLLSEQCLQHGRLRLCGHLSVRPSIRTSVHPFIPAPGSSSRRAAGTAAQAPQRSRLHT